MKITFEAHFDHLASVFEDYQYYKEAERKARIKCGYQKHREVWMPTAKQEYKDAVARLDGAENAKGALLYASKTLYKAVAMTRRIDKRFMVMHNWTRCLPNWQMERLMDYYMRADD